MTIETKFNPKEIVYVLKEGRIYKATIKKVNAWINFNNKIGCSYEIARDGFSFTETFNEDRIFYSKKEAGIKLLEINGLNIGITDD